jgi:hypothetical protein
MGSWNKVSSLYLLLIAPLACAQATPRTDAQMDDFAGAVKSVSTSVTPTGVKWRQPDGPTLVMPIWCRDCEYDQDGTKIKSGQVVGEDFHGELIRLVRDGNGHVTDRFATDASSGQMLSHDVMGPLGKIEETIYTTGDKVSSRQTFSYDQYGHLTELVSFDAAGEQTGRVQTIRDKDGDFREETAWGKNGVLDRRQTFDPVTQVEHFTTFDSSGEVTLTWTVAGGKLTWFWEAPDSPRQFGDNFSEWPDDRDAENYACHRDGRCDISRVHYDFLDPKKRNPKSAEWRDSEGNLLYADYFEYEIDSNRNWTSREVWVWTPELGERTLYETDSRTITYWQK